MIELEHSPLGGSGAHRFMTCAFSFLKQRELIEEGTFEDIPTEFAKLGTGAHELGAVCIATDAEPFEFIGDEFNGYLAGWPDGIELDAVQVYVNECRAIMDLCDYDGLAIVEKTYHLPDIHPLLKGTVDFGYLSPVRGIFLRDYKNGEGIGVETPNNRQLLYYAFLLILSGGNWTKNYRDMPVNLGIVQPNFYGIYEDVIPWITTVGYVLDWGYNELLPRMNALYQAPRDEPREEDAVPGDHCQFCPVLLDCPKMQKAFRVYADASEDFVAMLTNAELDELYSQREYARRFMKVLEATVLARLSTGGNIPSAKLVEKMTKRVWKPGGVAAIEAAFGEKAYKPKEPLSPAGVEKLSSRGKELALEYGYKPDSAGLVVAPLTDPRPPAKPRSNAGVFAEHARQAMEEF
jgi:hypothetical protein